MPQEIERKFLVVNNSWKKTAKGKKYKQGYILNSKGKTVRIRTAGKKGFITIKGKSSGAARDEYEYEIPFKDAKQLFALCEKPLIEKTRYKKKANGMVWEIDVFAGENKRLVVAEVELKSEKQKIKLPKWVGKEVTGIASFYNASLVKKPFSTWGKYPDLINFKLSRID